ncbi:MAG: DUF4424 family protein [Cellvibrio sp.]|uniref:DUF4424 family protein n=1 Tax=Cellvibrio sp. TaxID=1965322 RepID=UPI0031A24825
MNKNWITFGALVFSLTAQGNDSTARIGTTGIELVKTDDIEMQKETLTISQKEIRVEYDFYNKNSSDIDSLIAFPMPVYGFDLGVSAGTINVGPVKNFKVSSNGVGVVTKSTYKALLNGKDISHPLRTAGLNEEQIFQTFGGCKLNDDFSCEISDTTISKLKEVGAYTTEGVESDNKYPLGAAWSSYKYGPTWDVEQTLVWQQIFPAKKITNIVHTYSPMVGSIYNYPVYDSVVESDYKIQAAAISENNQEACIDDSFKRAYHKKLLTLRAAGAKNIMVMLKDVEYVLGTGRNWAGPIQDFTLRIKKENKDQLVSLCFPGKPVRIDPLTLEFKHKNFVPQDKLVVYFYSFHAD